jgi:hypothetical protein
VADVDAAEHRDAQGPQAVSQDVEHGPAAVGVVVEAEEPAENDPAQAAQRSRTR